jgi:hypothetical protein
VIELFQMQVPDQKQESEGEVMALGKSVTWGGGPADSNEFIKFELCFTASQPTRLQVQFQVFNGEDVEDVAAALVTAWNARSTATAALNAGNNKKVDFDVTSVTSMKVSTSLDFTLPYDEPSNNQANHPTNLHNGLTAKWTV